MKIDWLKPLIEFAIETAMRRGELVGLKWTDIDVQNRLAFLHDTKNGYDRTVPLSEAATTILPSIPRTSEYVFPVTGNAVRLAWARLRERAGIENLRFHDLRHEAISRLFERGLTLPEVALISGHRDYRMLLRYTHLTFANPDLLIHIAPRGRVRM